MNSKVRRTLLHHEALISDIRWKYKNARKEQGKKTVSEVVVGKIVKKYRLQRWSETALGTCVKLAPRLIQNIKMTLLFVCARFVLVCAVKIIVCAGKDFE